MSKQSESVVVPLLKPTKKAREFLGVGKNKLDALLKAGLVKAKLINGRRYFVTASLVAFLDTLADA